MIFILSEVSTIIRIKSYTCASLCYVALKVTRNKENAEVEDLRPSRILSFTFESISHHKYRKSSIKFRTSHSILPPPFLAF